MLAAGYGLSAKRMAMSQILRAVLLGMALLAAAPAHAQQQPAKIALLIGNQGYDRSVGELTNPHNDIAVIGAALAKQGFRVRPPVKEARRSVILGAVRELVRQLNAAGAGAIGFLYYSGHGAAESDTGFNYLIPIDAKEPGSATFWDDSLKLDDVLKLLDGARSAAKFIVFDACRNELRVPAKSTTKGLMPVAEQQGMFIAYSSAPGRTASDAGSTSGPYAAALATELGKGGQDHLNLFQNVKEAVIASTNGVQQPWFMDGLVRRIYPTGVPKTEPDQPKQPSPPSGAAEVVRICREVEGMTSLSMLAVLERQHKGTPAADCISARMGELRAAQSGAPIGKQASVAEPSQPARCTGSEVDVAGSVRRCLNPKDTFEDCFTSSGRRICGPKMAVIPQGRFLMGTSDAEIEALIKEYPKMPAEFFRREAPQREVSIGRAFAVGETHVTRGQFAAFVTATGHKTDGGCHAFDGKEWKLQAYKSWRDPGFAQDDSHPVVCVNWNDAQAYVAWIKQQSGAQYRLLSEAEAEYVARGVTAATRRTCAAMAMAPI